MLDLENFEEKFKITSKKQKMVLNSVRDVVTSANKQTATLEFISEESLVNETCRVNKKFTGNVTQIVKELLEFKGVELVLLSKNFLSVKKTEDVSWNELKPMVISHLNDYFEKNEGPILRKGKKIEENGNTDNETVNKIIEVLDTKIRPAVARDGGDIKFKSFENGVVKVQLQGSCSGCPSSLMTLKQGVQNLLKHYVKEVNSVEAVQ